MRRRSVLIRVDGNSSIGLGHVVRVRALATMLAPDFACEFAVSNSSPEAVAILSEQYVVHHLGRNMSESAHLEQLVDVCRRRSASIVVLDGYSFDQSVQTALRRSGLLVVVIDDFAREPVVADLVINHGSACARYAALPASKVLCGPAYALLRPPFIEAALRRREVGRGGRILVCMGGADPFGVTPRVVAALSQVPGISQMTIISGAAAEIEQNGARWKVAESQGPAVEFRRNLDAAAMVQAFREARVAFVTASSLALEACAVGCGLVLGTVADNQDSIRDELVKMNCALSIGDWKTATPQSISKAYEVAANTVEVQLSAQQGLVDGRSPERIRDAFHGLAA